MQFKYFFGVDVSKESLDICLWSDNQIVETYVIVNAPKAIKSYLKKMNGKGFTTLESLWCLEHTGVYIHPLINELVASKSMVWVESPTQIILSQGVKRGKNDKVDAIRIAQYAATFVHKARFYTPKRDELVQLKKLANLRTQLNESRVGIKKSLADAKRFLSKKVYQVLVKCSGKTYRALETDIAAIEKEMVDIIQRDENLSRLHKIVTSVDGIGLQSAIAILVTTNEFQDITEAKKYNCYCGVAPFEHQSGKSIKSTPRVSQKANKQVKKLLHMAALTVLKIPNSEYSKYYERKKEEGKNGMTIINAIRAKLIARVFACVRDQRLYTKKYIYAQQEEALEIIG